MAEGTVAVAVPKRIFITGALGLIGRRLGERYRAAGADVAGVDLRADRALGVVAGELTEPAGWEDAAAGADVFIHTAARLGMSGDAEAYWRVNVLGTRRALDAAARAGARRFVHFSSIVAYGFEFEHEADERYPLRANGVPYVDTKVASEQAVFQAHAAGEVPCTVIRPGDVYGPGSHFWTLTPVREIAARRLVVPAMGRGLIAPVYVDDLVEGVMLAAASPEAEGEAFNLTGGFEIEARDFFGRYARMLGRRRVLVAPTPVVRALAATLGRVTSRDGASEVTPAAVRYIARRCRYSIAKARRVLGYEPAVDLEEGMRRCEQWLRDEGLLPASPAE